MREAEISELIDKTAEAVAARLLARIRQERERGRDELFDRRLYNTRMLLRHYREFKLHAENAAYELDDLEKERTAVEIMDSMMNGPVGRGEAELESIRRSAQRTRIVVRHIDEMLAIYGRCCASAGKPEDLRKLDVINTLFINERPAGVSATELYEELADKYFVTPRQIHRDVDDAAVRLTALFFGIDGIGMLTRGKRGRKGGEEAAAEQ